GIYAWTVKYYKDSIEDDNQVGMESGTETFGEMVAVNDMLHAPDGYRKPGEASVTNITITSNPANNVATVLYTKDSFPYTIEYYQDAADGTGTLLGTVDGAAKEFGSDLTDALIAGDLDDPNWKDAKRPAGYLAGTIVTLMPLKIGVDGNVVQVLYVEIDASLNVEKTAQGEPGTVYNLGDEIEYHVKVTNTGNVLLTDITVSDPMVDTVTSGHTMENGLIKIASLAPDAFDIIVYTHTVTAKDIANGDGVLVNVATAEAPNPNPEGDPVEDSDEETVDIEPNNRIIIRGRKQWTDGESSEPQLSLMRAKGTLSHPPVTIKLLRDGAETGKEKTLTNETGWVFEFEPQPRYSGEGKEYAYSVSEGSISGYRLVGITKDGPYEDGNIYIYFTVTNEPYSPPAPTTYTVTYQPGEHGTFAAQSYPGLGLGAATPGFSGTAAGEDGWLFTGWLPSVQQYVTGDANYVAQWVPEEPQPGQYELSVLYWYGEINGRTAAPTYRANLAEGAAYNVASPRIKGWTPDLSKVFGVMPKGDVRADVVYDQNEYTLTINYVYTTGGTAAPTYRRTAMNAGDRFAVTSPVIDGYTASDATISGTMPAYNLTVTVYYAPTGTPEEPEIPLVDLMEYGVPLGVGAVVANVGECFE
ncbi:Cna B-type domain-containing protein, partial [Bacillota bacterium Meth-B3]